MRRKSAAMPRTVPKLASDAEAETFLDQDLADLDFAQFQPARFEFGRKDARVNMRLPGPLLDAYETGTRKPGHVHISPRVQRGSISRGNGKRNP